MPKQQVADVLEHGSVPSPTRSSTRLALLADEVREAWARPLVRRGTLGAALIGAGSLTPAFLPPNAAIVRTLHLQWLGSPSGRFASTLLLVAGMALLVDAWLRLRPREGMAPLHRLTWVLWSLPVLLAPPLFSRDAYSYAAQGRLIAEGYSPYQVGPVYVPGPFRDQVDPMWLFTPAPYGPLALQVQHAIVSPFGDNAYAAAIAMRLPVLLAVALLAYALPRLAERFGVSREQATWLGVLNPLVFMHLVGGAHGDAMMISLIVFALLLASRGRLVLAAISVAGAASFKQTAVLALIGVIGMALQSEHAPRHLSRLRAYARAGAIYGSITAATFIAITYLTGLGWGWLPNLAVPVSLRSLLSPPTLVGSAVEGLMRLSGMPPSELGTPVAVAQSIGMVVGVGAIGWVAWRLGPRVPVVATGVALLVLCAAGPVVHPWYLLWGGLLLAATRLSVRVVETMIWVTVFFVTYGIFDATLANGTWALGVTVTVGMLARMLYQRGGSDPNDPTDFLGLSRDLRVATRPTPSTSSPTP